METVKNIAAIIGCISALIALITTIVKPIRKKFVDWVNFGNYKMKLEMQ